MQNTKHTAAGTFAQCLCGCEQNIAGKASYRPGHDARHAGAVGRYLATLVDGESDSRWDAALQVLPSGALARKAERMAFNIREKAIAKGVTEDSLVKDQDIEWVPSAQGTPFTQVMLDADPTLADKIPTDEPKYTWVSAKVGRWVYEGALNAAGDEFEYVTKSGKRETATKFTLV